MIWLVSLPIGVFLCSFLFPATQDKKAGRRAFMVVCSALIIFVMGLRSRYTGSMDTYLYTLAFDGAQNYAELSSYLIRNKVMDSFWLFSECGFYSYTWLAARILPDAQWFLLLTSAIVICCTASFISRHSEDPAISWIVFICLGSMTFAMNGMRQALAMSICLLSYRYAKEKKLFRFLLIVLIAVLFHKSAMIFLLVYPMRRMKLNWSSFACLTAGVVLFFALSDRFAFLYDSVTGEDYALGESLESGGLVTVLIYLIAIVGALLFCKRLKETEAFVPFTLAVVGFCFFVSRFLSVQIYERISYYFAYFLMLLFPLMFQDLKGKERALIRIFFVLLAVLLFAYRTSTGAFADFAMFW